MTKSTKRHHLRHLFFKLTIVGLVVFGAFTVYLDALIRHKFEGNRWSIPAKVYAHPLTLALGERISQDHIQFELDKLGYQPSNNPRSPGLYRWEGDTLWLFNRGFQFYDDLQTAQLHQVEINNDQVKGVWNSAREPLLQLRLEPLLIGGIYAAHKEDRELVQIKDAPQQLIETLVLVEDHGFYQHHGISARGIARAMMVNLSAGKFKQGGSTLTQQLIKNFYLTNRRSLSRKLIEAYMALLLELHYSKNEILEAYINEIYLGQDGNRAIHGFGLAAQFYFGIPLQQLDSSQIALLVGMVKGPSYYNPRKHPSHATQRRNLVLGLMADDGILSSQFAGQLQKQPIKTIPRSHQAKDFPAFMSLVKRQLHDRYNTTTLAGSGLKIFTTLDPYLQTIAENSVTKSIQDAQQDYYPKLKNLQGALVVQQANNGNVLAMVSDKEPSFPGFNRAIDAYRPIGSLIKPLTYLTAMEENLSWADPVSDAPISISSAQGEWTPGNFSRNSHGTPPDYLVSLLSGLIHSYNLAAIHLGMDVGIEPILSHLSRMGIHRKIAPYPSTLLGSVELSPLEVSGIYQSFANNGKYQPPVAVTAIMTQNLDVSKVKPASAHQASTATNNYLLSFGLEQVIQRGTGRRAKARLGDIKLAGKTGTTDDGRDSWFAGYSDRWVVTSWMGLDDNSATPLTGNTGALESWINFMAEAQPQSITREKPADIQWTWINPSNHSLSGKLCSDAIEVPFKQGTLPSKSDTCGKIRHTPAKVGRKLKSWLQKLLGQ